MNCKYCDQQTHTFTARKFSCYNCSGTNCHIEYEISLRPPTVYKRITFLLDHYFLDAFIDENRLMVYYYETDAAFANFLINIKYEVNNLTPANAQATIDKILKLKAFI